MKVKNGKVIGPEDIARLNIQKANDKIHGFYPMTYDVLMSQINRVNPGTMTVFDNGTMISAKAAMKFHAGLFKDRPERMYEYYLDEVKPYIF